MPYSDVDNSHEFLVEKVLLLENVVREMASILVHFHPYMGAVIQELAERDQAACAKLVEMFPSSKILTPGLSIVKPH